MVSLICQLHFVVSSFIEFVPLLLKMPGATCFFNQDYLKSFLVFKGKVEEAMRIQLFWNLLRTLRTFK